MNSKRNLRQIRIQKKKHDSNKNKSEVDNDPKKKDTTKREDDLSKKKSEGNIDPKAKDTKREEEPKKEIRW